MSSLLQNVIEAHGGLKQWKSVRSVEVEFNYSGWVLDLVGFPGHCRPTVTIDVTQPKVVFQRLGGESDDRWFFTPEKVWIKGRDGHIIKERDNPRASFEGFNVQSKWDELHLTYFIGYAMWNYICTPFLFAEPGFSVKELEEFKEGAETWRTMEVTYPDNFPTHTKIQTYYFDTDYMLRRIDYVPDVNAGVASHYCYDAKEVEGIKFPYLRRVVARTDKTAHLSAPSAFLLDYIKVKVFR